jgi:gamma-glutamylcyclotransferase (GGCT)/AIG2-like uncharacterized protein YtfP
MSVTVFTYGSLMFPQVWERVVRGRYRSIAAEAGDHARYAIHGQTYPGMIGQPGARVCGLLYFDVSDDDVAALDEFEGGDYQRRWLDVRLAEGGILRAAAYLYLPTQLLSGSPWLPQAFQMRRFMQQYCGEPLAG